MNQGERLLLYVYFGSVEPILIHLITLYSKDGSGVHLESAAILDRTGAYVLQDARNEKPELIIMGTGA